MIKNRAVWLLVIVIYSKALNSAFPEPSALIKSLENMKNQLHNLAHVLNPEEFPPSLPPREEQQPPLLPPREEPPIPPLPPKKEPEEPKPEEIELEKQKKKQRKKELRTILQAIQANFDEQIKKMRPFEMQKIINEFKKLLSKDDLSDRKLVVTVTTRLQDYEFQQEKARKIEQLKTKLKNLVATMQKGITQENLFKYIELFDQYHAVTVTKDEYYYWLDRMLLSYFLDNFTTVRQMLETFKANFNKAFLSARARHEQKEYTTYSIAIINFLSDPFVRKVIKNLLEEPAAETRVMGQEKLKIEDMTEAMFAALLHVWFSTVKEETIIEDAGRESLIEKMKALQEKNAALFSSEAFKKLVEPGTVQKEKQEIAKELADLDLGQFTHIVDDAKKSEFIDRVRALKNRALAYQKTTNDYQFSKHINRLVDWILKAEEELKPKGEWD